MQLRQLGKSGIEVAPIVFGGNVFGWTIDEKQSFALLDALGDPGINMIDTANVYSAWVNGNQGGESEQIIGNWLAKTGKRDQILIASKVGMTMGDGSSGLSYENIIRSAEASLKRLQTDYIDVYYAHQDDPETPLEESLSAFQKLIDDGKVRTIASSNYSAERLAETLNLARQNNLPQFIAHQPEYNLFDRESYEGELENICREFDLGVVTYFSLASGFLSGKYRSQKDLENSSRGKAFLEKYLNERGLKILNALDQVAAQHNTSVASVAIAWILGRPGVTAPIASATTLEQLQQLSAAADLKLSESDMQTLNQASAQS